MVAYDTVTLRGDSNVCPDYNFYHIYVYDLTNAHAHISTHTHTQGRVAQSITSLTADPGVTSSILARSHTFVGD